MTQIFGMWRYCIGWHSHRREGYHAEKGWMTVRTGVIEKGEKQYFEDNEASHLSPNEDNAFGN